MRRIKLSQRQACVSQYRTALNRNHQSIRVIKGQLSKQLSNIVYDRFGSRLICSQSQHLPTGEKPGKVWFSVEDFTPPSSNFSNK